MNSFFNSRNSRVAHSRRQFLKVLRNSGISSKLLLSSSVISGLLASRYAQAQGNTRNIIFVCTPHGAPSGSWMPSSLEQMNTITQPFAAHAKNMAFRLATSSNLTLGLPQYALGASTFNPKEARSSSLNMQMAKVIGRSTPYSSLQLGVGTNDKEVISRLNGQPVINENDPEAVFKRLFNVSPPLPDANVGLGRNELKQRKSLALHRAAFKEVEAKVAHDEKIELEAHLSWLEKMDQRIGAVPKSELEPSGICSVPDMPTWGDSVIGTFKTHSDLVCEALRCGLTRIVSIQVGSPTESWHGANSGEDTPEFIGSHHEACHTRPEHEIEMATYLSKCVAYLIGKLSSQGLLENTIVAQLTDDGQCATHTPENAYATLTSRVDNFSPGIARTGYYEDVLADAVKGMGLEGFVGGYIADYGEGSGVFS